MTQSSDREIEAILASARQGAQASVRNRPARRSYYDRARRRRGGWVMSLNLTPMIDTVFNLLFFFMVASRFGAIEGLLPAKLPVKTSAAQAAAGLVAIPRVPLRIRLEADPTQADRCLYRIDRLSDVPAPVRELPDRLARIRRDEPGFDAQTPVYLVAGDTVSWDHVVNAYNAALSASYEKIFFSGAP